MIRFYDTLIPYKTLPNEPIQYGVCKDFDHVSRYRSLRQVVHNTQPADRFVSLETPNPFSTRLSNMKVHEVSYSETNRLDIIADKYLGNASYAWIIAYINEIEDGYSVYEGQKLKIPHNITELMQSGELLQSIPVMQLNLGVE